MALVGELAVETADKAPSQLGDKHRESKNAILLMVASLPNERSVI